jgi:hypothetical protein
MKTTQFENIMQTLDRLQTYGVKNNANAKRLASLIAVVDTINANNNKETIKKSTFDAFKGVLKQLPKDVRGFAKKELYKVIDIAVEENDTLYFLNVDGSINYKRVWGKVSPSYNKELFVILQNLIIDVFQDAEKHCNNIIADKKFNAYLDAMNDELNEYSIPQLLKAC